MITAEQANYFANQWIMNWNNHDIDSILDHYADDIEFHSPIITALKFNERGVINNKDELRSYFEKGLAAYPDLHFQTIAVFTGIYSIVLYYSSVNGKFAAETFELNNESKAIKVLSHYTI